jgi:intein/homing endonuclease
VEEVFTRTGAVWALRVEGRTIETTAEHPFYALEKGWVPARESAAVDTLLCEDWTWWAV